MKFKLLAVFAAAVLLTGCAELKSNYAGGAAFRDNDVLTGGPVVGTKISDLPQAVQQTLQQNYPREEVADVDRVMREGQQVYLITFARRGGNPVVSIANDGRVIQEMGIGRDVEDWGQPSPQNAPANQKAQ